MLAHVGRGALGERGNRAFQRTQASRGHGTLEYMGEGNAEQPAGVFHATRATRITVVIGVLNAVCRHKSVFHHDVVAAGAAQAQHIPVVFNAVVALGQQEGHMLKAGCAIAFGQQSAQEQPVAMLGAGGEAPAAIELETAFHRLGLAGRHIGRGNAHAAVLAPDIFLRLSGEQTQLPGVHTDHAINPGGGHTALGQFHLHAIENAWVHFIATPALGLQHTKQTRLGHLLNGFVADLAFAICLLCASGQLGRQRLGTLDHGQRIGGEVVVCHCVHSGLQLPLHRTACGVVGKAFLPMTGMLSPCKFPFIVRSD